jgi:pilus assembly protein FimV
MAHSKVRLIAPVLLGLLVLLVPTDALRALGLGEARVDSWLGQRLDVTIRLLEIESEAVESVSVGPATLEDFERLGVPSEVLALGLEVTVDRAASPPLVRVRSQEPVNDPVIQFLLDASWSNGRVLREYTLFLDPPMRDSAPPVRRVDEAAETAPEAEREVADERPRPEPTPPAPVAGADRADAEASDAAPASVPAGSVAVEEGDTLWSIAYDWRPSESLSMDQVMLAIFNRNRDAFLGQNINRLRSDVQLDMPSVDSVGALDAAEAEREVREQMRSWQQTVPEQVPTVSDAGVAEPEPAPAEAEPEAPAQEPDGDSAAPETDTAGAEAAEEEATADSSPRLDVVPPEEDSYAEEGAVSESELAEVRESLAEVRSEIVSEGIDNPELDDRMAEIDQALDQRDLAGLAVAQESLAELEARLREVREAQAEEAAADEQAGDETASDPVSQYMDELQSELAADDPSPVADDESPADEGAADAGTDEQAAVADTEGDTGTEAEGEAAGETRPMTVTRTSGSGGWMDWLWPALAAVALVIVLIAAVLWRRQRQDAAGSAGPERDALEAARARVDREPESLAAHLGLLRVLGERGGEEQFADAFDQMYQVVDDESDPDWQEALTLAAAYAPDHPLLTPSDDGGEQSEIDRRTDEMLGMFDTEAADVDGEGGFDDFEPSTRESGEDEADEGSSEELSEDMDLAVLSERLDEDSGDVTATGSRDEGGDIEDFDQFEEIDEYAPPAEETPEEQSSVSAVDVDDDGLELDLDFEPAREQEADDVVGEAGARDEEDLDLEFTSDADEEVDVATDDTGFGIDDPTREQGAPAEETPAAGAGGEEDAGIEPRPEDGSDTGQSAEPAGGTLNDEDADVKLDLARAYISVDLADSARTVLEEVVSDGSPDKQDEARKLLDDLD